MAKPEWGLKRACQGCGARYYDLLRTPPVCPHCEAEFVADPIGRRRSSAAPALASRPAAEKAPAKPVKAAAKTKAKAQSGDAADDDDDIDVVSGDEVDDSLIEDTDDLSEDEDDVAEVKVHIEDDGKDKGA